MASPQHLLVHGVVSPQVQDFVHPLEISFHEFPVSQSPQSVEVSLDNSMMLWYISHSSHFCVIIKLAEGTLCPVTQIINGDIELDWTQ